MPSEPALTVEGLGKRYDLGDRSGSLREALPALLRRRPADAGAFWALRDVSFTVRPGERLGIIGRNGAGKSTLLRILARITAPSEGRAVVRGRMASLLEVGTGFHPELTGRENVFLNGAILGMRRSEVARRFDEIVAFAEIAAFIDVPVKRWSTGMQMRLAFSVAAHLDAEILLVDEVLAVGDAAFQRKCLGRIEGLAGSGRAVLFVSHQLAAVSHLCDRAILLEGGRLRAEGTPAEVIRTALAAATPGGGTALAARTDRQGDGRVRFARVSLRDGAGAAVERAATGQALVIELSLARAPGPLAGLQVAIGLDDELGARVAHLGSEPAAGALPVLADGVDTVLVRIPHLPLMPGSYRLTLYATVGGAIADWVQEAWTLEVDPGDFYGTGRLIPDSQGRILIEHAVEAAPIAPARA